MDVGLSVSLRRAPGRFEPRGLPFAALVLAGLTLVPVPLNARSATSNPSATSPATKTAKVKSFRIIQEKDGPAVEILSTRPLAPQIHLLKEPTRLVIDLPNARIDMAETRIEVQSGQISTLRANQFQEKPPMARVVVDMLTPRTYTWEAAGNRLVVHLGRTPAEASESPFETASLPTLTQTGQPVVRAVRAAGPLVLASDSGKIGTSFTAGADTAVLSLSSGGELHVCPGTTVSIIPSANRHNLLLGMNTGAIEAHLELDSSADMVMTPDFRIALEGPGQFHYAFSTDNHGDTCVRALAGNTAAAKATELLGGRTYQIKATDQLVFRGGGLDRVDMNVPLECGCPPPRQNVERAANEAPAGVATASETRPAARESSLGVEPAQTQSAPGPGTPGNGASASGSATQPEMHVQVTTPLVFHASGPPLAAVDASAGSGTAAAAPKPMAIVIATRTQKDGFFRRVGGWFAKIFR